MTATHTHDDIRTLTWGCPACARTRRPPAGATPRCGAVRGQGITLWGFHVAMEHGGDFAKAAGAVRTTMQVAAGVAAAPAARVATATTTVACPHCGSTNTKERVG